MTTAFVLSGGASLGSIQVGMAQALFESGVEPDMVVGSSVGAINGSWLASAKSVDELADVWRSLRRSDLSPVPFTVIATDARSGEEVPLAQGPTIPAVLASAALPGVFPPVTINGRGLIDGGVVNNTPITHAIESGATEVWVLSTGYSCGLANPPQAAIAMAMHSIALLVQQRLVIETSRRSGSATGDPTPCR